MTPLLGKTSIDEHQNQQGLCEIRQNPTAHCSSYPQQYIAWLPTLELLLILQAETEPTTVYCR